MVIKAKNKKVIKNPRNKSVKKTIKRIENKINKPRVKKKVTKHNIQQKKNTKTYTQTGLLCSNIKTTTFLVCNTKIYIPSRSYPGGGYFLAWFYIVVFNIGSLIPLFNIILCENIDPFSCLTL